MTGKHEMELWYWQDESFKLDSESPLVITPSFWEEATENRDGSPTSNGIAPVVDARSYQSSAACCAFAVDHQGSVSHGSRLSEYIQQHGERCKRRRMLHFVGARTEGITSVSSPYLNILGSPPPLHFPFESCTPRWVSGNEECILPVRSGMFGSSPRVENFSNSVLSNAQQPGNKCIVRSFDEIAHSACEQTKAPVLLFNDYNTSRVEGNTLQKSQHFHRPQISQDAEHVQQFQHRLQTHQLQVTDVLQGPRTPFSKPPISGQRQSMGPSRFKGKSSKRVVFPFALVKPSAAQGDVTLHDINQLLLCAPPRPEQKVIVATVENPPAQSGAGLSGKSVVACTKIHTGGNGTITIMRTMG